MLRRETRKPSDLRDPSVLAVLWSLVVFTMFVCCVARLAFALVMLLAGCSPIGEVKDIGADFAEVSYCEVEHCGQVFECTLPTPYGGAGGTLTPELCWESDDSATLATSLAQQYGYPVLCVPTSRGGAFGWPCLYCCGDRCGRGANAYQGRYCP